MATDHNPLIQNEISPIRWWAIAIFVAVMPVLLVLVVWLLRDRGMLPMLAAFFASGLIAVALAMAPMGWAALSALGFRSAGWKPVILGTLGGLVISVAVSHLGVEPEGMKQAMEVVRDPALFAASLVVMAGLAPLVEELVFRGLLYGFLCRWGTTVAWIVSSLAFAAAHVELAHVVLVLPLGLWFGWLRRRTDSLWPSLVAHIANNGLAVLAAALFDSG